MFCSRTVVTGVVPTPGGCLLSAMTCSSLPVPGRSKARLERMGNAPGVASRARPPREVADVVLSMPETTVGMVKQVVNATAGAPHAAPAFAGADQSRPAASHRSAGAVHAFRKRTCRPVRIEQSARADIENPALN
jgi:hypothetical protein